MTAAESEIVREFNQAINDADPDRLRAMMSPNHRFVDSAGAALEGVPECVAAWESFFKSFPGYRNDFESVEVISPGQVVARGRSHCSFAPLDGPAVWRALVHDGLVAEWRVEDLLELP